jgi:hypothetical protein
MKSYHRTGLCLRSNRSLFVVIYFAGKGIFEARDWRLKNLEVGKNGAPRDQIWPNKYGQAFEFYAINTMG